MTARPTATRISTMSMETTVAATTPLLIPLAVGPVIYILYSLI